jgi:hypothetical protein
MKSCLIVAFLPLCAWAQPDLNEILRRVAENQEKAVEARSRVVYTQSTLARLMRGNGKLAREERRRYSVFPTPIGTDKKLESCEGQYEVHGKRIPYSDPKFRYKGMDIDGDLVQSIVDDMVDKKDSKDGISPDLFPLTAKRQAHYDFKLAGTEEIAGVQALHLTFAPKKGDEDANWAGDVLVDPVDYQPIRVTTKLAMQIPMAVKVLLGTNIRQLGFTLTCKKVANGLWFPVSYGSEFHLRVLFGYARTIALSLENKDFREASAESKIEYTPAEAKPD